MRIQRHSLAIEAEPDCVAGSRSAPLLDDDARRRALALLADLLPDAPRHLAVHLGVLAVGLRHHDRCPFVGGLADGDRERHLAEEVDAELLRLAAGAAVAEDLAAVAAIGAREIAHILDDA